ncbi:MAG: hypothetical protein WC599_11900 [Bacteroidales bacterium]
MSNLNENIPLDVFCDFKKRNNILIRVPVSIIVAETLDLQEF